MPANWLGHEREIAARLIIDFADLRERALDHLLPGQRYLRLDPGWLIGQLLGELVDNKAPNGGAILVANVDLMVSSFRADARMGFWEALRRAYRPLSGLLLIVPVASQRLISPAERELWAVEGRLARWHE